MGAGPRLVVEEPGEIEASLRQRRREKAVAKESDVAGCRRAGRPPAPIRVANGTEEWTWSAALPTFCSRDLRTQMTSFV